MGNDSKHFFKELKKDTILPQSATVHAFTSIVMCRLYISSNNVKKLYIVTTSPSKKKTITSSLCLKKKKK